MLNGVFSVVLGLTQVPNLDEAARTLALLRTPAQELKLEQPLAQGRSGSLLPLLQAYAALCGWKLATAEGLEAQLAQTPSGLWSAGSIARDDVHPLVQSLARLRGLCFRLTSEGDQTKLSVEREEQAFAAPIAVSPEMLPAWSSHPAFALTLDLRHAPEGSQELCARLKQLLASGRSRADVVRLDSGALRLTGSPALLAFVVGSLREGPQLALGLDAITFPPDPNTPEGKTPARLPGQLQDDFPSPDGPLTLPPPKPPPKPDPAPPKADAAKPMPAPMPPKQLEVLTAYARWSGRALCFVSDATLTTLAYTPLGAGEPTSIPSAWVHEFVSGLLADERCALTPLPARRPVLLALEKAPQSGAAPLDLAGLPAIRLDQLAAVAHLAATRFQTFVRLPKLDEAQRQQLGALASPDERTPFWITELDEPSVFSLIGTPRALTSAVLTMKLTLAPPKAR